MLFATEIKKPNSNKKVGAGTKRIYSHVFFPKSIGNIRMEIDSMQKKCPFGYYYLSIKIIEDTGNGGMKEFIQIFNKANVS